MENTNNKPRCYFDEYADICAALMVKKCEGCKFYKSTAEYAKAQADAERTLDSKGLKAIEYRDKYGIMHKSVMKKEGI